MFQTLIGTVKTHARVYEALGQALFQTLIGTVKTAAIEKAAEYVVQCFKPL